MSNKVEKMENKVITTVGIREPACRVADQYIKQFNLQDKIHTQVLDFFKDKLPDDCDVAFLSHIIHFLGEEKDKILLKSTIAFLVIEMV